MPIRPSVPFANRLLAALPRAERERFVADCEPVALAFAQVLAESGERIRHVYFPQGCLIALTASTDARGSLEVGLIGDEGMLGATLALDGERSLLRALVQGAGPALRMEAQPFRGALAASPALRCELNRYLCVMLRQLAQASACNRFHVLEERLARWLLMTQDRAHADAFLLTHAFMAQMLGVRRVGVTKAASSLQERKLISYRRGHVEVLDRPGLEAAACGCYAADTVNYARTMAGGHRPG